MVDVGNQKGISMDGGGLGRVCLLGEGGYCSYCIVETMKIKMLITKKKKIICVEIIKQGCN